MIVGSDAFMDMPISSQCLYFHLGMMADDEGFINNPKRILRMVGANEDDLKILVGKRFVVAFESGVIVIKHWKMHNSLRADRAKKTVYAKEKELLEIKENGSYTLKNKGLKILVDNSPSSGNQMSTTCPHSIDKIRLDKVSIDKNSIGECEGETPNPLPPKKQKPIKHKYGEYENVLLEDKQLEKLKELYPDWELKIKTLDEGKELKGYKYKNDYLAIMKWAKNDAQKISKENPITNNPFLAMAMNGEFDDE